MMARHAGRARDARGRIACRLGGTAVPAFPFSWCASALRIAAIVLVGGLATATALAQAPMGIVPTSSDPAPEAVARTSDLKRDPAAGAETSMLAQLGTAAPETVILQITLNAENKGQYFVSMWDGDFLIRVQDLKAMGIADPRGRVRIVDGEEMIALKSIDGVSARFDERKLALDLIADPRLLPTSTVDFAAGRKRNVFYPTNPSAFLNYDVSYAGSNSGLRDTIGVATELGARMGDFLLLSDSTYYGTTSERRFVRLMTSVIHDDRDTLVRTIVGDFAVGAGDLSSSVLMGGVSYSKLYSMDPYFVRYPQQNLTGVLRTASEVDVYIDGQRVRTLRLPPGEFDLRDITQAPGLRNVQLVIRDAFGREQKITAPFYSTEVPLKAGLQEYSYNVGALREMFGVESNDYGPLAFAGFHRWGVTDALTLGVHGEGKSGVYNAGATASIVLGAAGLLNLSASGSGNGGRTGGAALASYSYFGTHFNAGLLLRKQSREYTQLIQVGTENPNYDIAATVGYTDPVVGSISAGVSTRTSYGGQPDRNSASVSYGRSLFDGHASVFVTVMNTWGQEKSTNVFAGFVYNFDATYSASARYERFQGNTTEAFQFQKAQPTGDGLGYTLAAERTGTPEGTFTRFLPSFQYNSPWGIIRGSASQQNDRTGSQQSYSLSAAGGLALVGGATIIGRPVTDAFGVVKVDDLEGVRVYVNNQEIGRTDANGRVLLPALASFVDNQISINAANVPLDVSFPESMRVVSPPYRGGAVIDFHAKRLMAVTGTLKIRLMSGGDAVPAEFYQVTLAVDGKPFTFPTGRGGEFYVEDLKPGRHAARGAANGHSCSFDFVVPDSGASITELPPIVCEAGR
jgi:outer membrane usher protein FimD/PapC